MSEQDMAFIILLCSTHTELSFRTVCITIEYI